MFDLDAGKLLIIAIVALVVIPPKDFPSVMRQVGQALGKMRRMAAEFQSQFMDAIHEAELDEIRNNVQKLADDAKLDVEFDPVAAIRDELKSTIGEGPVVAGTLAAGPTSTESAITKEEPESHPLSTDMTSPNAPAAEAAAAGIAPLAPTEGGEAKTALSRMAAETTTATPSVPQPEESGATAQQADARRS